ncbi:Bug family tripartite tricarboxylate transporter substrate binding protein [Desmospora activa]|uniref:Tripartite-type tricarboxylate transporter receptor subunit TctC n=1 Tax=Desmospora activa DSM 45169 TaxID=1121389 RepID=A0A2T4ZB09_9BACL|nr:tripartite tricarboxylate transporter substrate binding protein [Desmospora activa]PTM59047.1 tripartite-type tricarboxylate transporter receptor subunit TctC [Desmospora activa DSM 45169]
MKQLIIPLLITLSFVIAACTPQANQASTASSYPNRPIEMVVPFGEGSASDTFARKFADIMNQDLAHPIQPINKDGGGGVIGMYYAHGREANGYTVFEVTPSHVIADVIGTSKVKLMRDFEPLAQIQSDIYVVLVPADSPIDSFDQLLEEGQKRKIKVAGVSPGGLDDLTLGSLAKETGIKTTFVPYRSGSEVKAAVLGGEVDMYMDKLISAASYVQDGKVKPLVILNDERVSKVPEFKEVPTTVEKGYDVTIGSWRGFAVKKGTPDHIKKELIVKMKAAYETDEYKEYAAQNLADLNEGYKDPEAFHQEWEEQYVIFEEVATDLGLKE